MSSIFLWWFAVLILGLVGLPISFVALKQLPDKGYVFSKVFSLLLAGYFFWLFGHASYGFETLLAALILLTAISGFLLYSWVGKPFVEYFKKNLGYIIVVESLFLMAFLVAGAYKMRAHDIVGTEKPMDFAFINGILSSTSMPPQDPWLSGGSISYYYFGYFIVAMLCKLTGVASGEAYNLGVALTWALSATCAFSLGFALTRRYRYSLLSAFSLVVLGNLDYWHRAVQIFRVGDLRIPYYNQPTSPGVVTGLSASLGFLFHPFRHAWDYFQASRIVPVSASDKLINEFPSFSFFLSDLHPHVMAIPFDLLAIALALNLLRGSASGLSVFSGPKIWRYFQLFLLALVFGSLLFFNSWDFPTFMLLLGLCLFLQQWWANGTTFGTWLKSVAVIGIPVTIGAFLLFTPFFMKFQSQAQGVGFAGSRTGLYYLVVIFGLFLTVLIPALVGIALRERGEKNQRPKNKRSETLECVICGKESTGKKFCGYCGGELASPSDGEVVALPDEKFRGVLNRMGSWFSGGAGSLRGWVALAVTLLVLLLANIDSVQFGTFFLSLKYGTFLLAVLLAAFCLMALASGSSSREMVFSMLLVFIGFLLLAWCEVFYLKDLFSSGNNQSPLHRMNTVFKFHFQVWIFFSIAIGPFLKWLMENLWPKWKTWKKAVWAGIAGFAFLGAFLYPVMAFTARLQGTSADQATLNGAAFYERTFPTNYQAALWIKQNVKPIGDKTPVILEAWGRSYHQEENCLATLTGYPTVLGWDFHEVQWRGSGDKAVIRGGDPNDTIMKREADIDAIYTSADLNQTRDLLRKYQVEYVYVGDAERQKYKEHAENLGKFMQLGSLKWSWGNAALYKVNP